VDSLRGIAACTVALIFHLRNFGGDSASVPYVQYQPVKWLYDFGGFGVDLFFVLSGFIFALKYAEPVRQRVVGPYKFFILRFSRLYPLHLATLLVAAAVLSLIHAGGTNDAYHFVLNLLMIQFWGFQKGFSFNTPAWTLSLEALCYIVFFLLARSKRIPFIIGSVCLLAIGIKIEIQMPDYPLLNFNTGQALVAFFSGCIVALIFRSEYRVWARWMALAIVINFIVSAAIDGTFSAALPYYYLSFDLLLFPSVLLCAISFPWLKRALEIRPLVFLGALSYTIYMVHFLVQMCINTAFLRLARPVPYTELWFAPAYAAVVIALSWAVHSKFELPSQQWIRAKHLRQRESRTAVPATT
jgi:peptidoglycan/LPS O-acetylase OafA/YrhL